jgi:hypothetical protein
MSSRTEAIAAELRQIRGATAEDIAVLMVPLIRAIEDGRASWEQGPDGTPVASMANSLAQLAAQLGDMETAVAIASLQADIEALTADERSPARAAGDHGAPTPHSGTTKPQPDLDARSERDSSEKRSNGLAGPTLKLLALLGLGALTYAAYLAIGRHPQTEATSLGMEIAPGPVEAGTKGRQGESIALWWMGAAPPDRAADDQQQSPMTPSAAPPSQSAALGTSESDPNPNNGSESGDRSPKLPPSRVQASVEPAGSDELPASAAPSPREQYRRFIDQDVLLTDGNGAQHPGTLTAINADGVTLRTQVLMFGEPIIAHRLFLFDSIADIRTDSRSD